MGVIKHTQSTSQLFSPVKYINPHPEMHEVLMAVFPELAHDQGEPLGKGPTIGSECLPKTHVLKALLPLVGLGKEAGSVKVCTGQSSQTPPLPSLLLGCQQGSSLYCVFHEVQHGPQIKYDAAKRSQMEILSQSLPSAFLHREKRQTQCFLTPFLNFKIT